MRGVPCIVSIAVIALATLAFPASAGIVDFAVGVYGGANFPMDESGDAGTVYGAKLRVLPPLPMIGAEAYYQRVGRQDPDDVWNNGDVNIDFNGDGFDVYGADVLIGGVRGVPGFKWYGIAGVNFVEFSKSGSSERRMGGELGVGVELVPPALGLSVEGRAMVSFLGWGEDPSPQIATFTVGLNYYF